MATEWISPTWRMPEESNQSKFENYSLDFKGINDYINSSINGTSTGGILAPIDENINLTIAFWVNVTAASALGEGILEWGNAATPPDTTPFITVRHRAGYYEVCCDGNYNLQSAAASVNYGSWDHIAFTRKSSTNIWTLYLNGVSVDTFDDGGGAITNRASSLYFNIGQGYSIGGDNLVGKMSEVSIFDYELSLTQVKYLWDNNAGGTTPNPQNPMAIAGNAPIAYYPLGGSSTGDADDPATTLTVPNNSVPSATVFDFTNSSNRIDFGVLNELEGVTKFTTSVWVNPSSFPSPYLLMGNWDNSYIGMVVDARSSLTLIYMDPDGSANDYVRTTNGLPADTWTLFSIVYDGTLAAADRLKVYYDKTLQVYDVTGGTIPAISPAPSLPFRLGYVNGNSIVMQASNLITFDEALTSGEIETLYNNGTPLSSMPSGTLTDNLKGWWKLNVDTSTWNGSNWEIGDSTANYTSALNFNTQNVNCGTNLGDTLGATCTNASVSIWFKNVDNTTEQAIFAISASYFGTGYFTLWKGAAGYIKFGLLNANYIRTLIAPYPAGTWNHVVITYDGSQSTLADSLKLYVNGQEPTASYSPSGGTGTPPASINLTSQTFVIGSSDATNHKYVGDLSNVAIFGSTLSPGDVTTLYNNGTPEETITGSPLSWLTLKDTSTAAGGGLVDNGSVGSNGTNGGTTKINSFVSSLNGLSDGMTTANLVASNLTRSIPYSSYSMYFDGVASTRILLGHPPAFDLTTSLSLSCWIKTDTNGAQYDPPFMAFDGGATRYGFEMHTAGEIVFDVVASGSAVRLPSTMSIADDEWHHIVGTWDGSDMILYVDGVQDATAARTGIIATPIDGLNIGGFGGGAHTSYDWEGNASNAALWNSVLTADQVLTIYNGGVPNDISSLSPIGYWSLAGDSYFDGTDWTCPDLSGNGNNGDSDGTMGGEELVGDGPGSTANGVATNMDIPANLKGDAPNSTKNAFSVNMDTQSRVAV